MTVTSTSCASWECYTKVTVTFITLIKGYGSDHVSPSRRAQLLSKGTSRMAFTVYIGPQKNDFTVGLLPALLPPGHDLRGLHGTRRPAKRLDRIEERPSHKPTLVSKRSVSPNVLGPTRYPSGTAARRAAFATLAPHCIRCSAGVAHGVTPNACQGCK
jgi:hypothetical protein